MQILQTALQVFGGEKTLRCDFDYHKYYKKHQDNYYSFYDLFEFPKQRRICTDELIEDFLYCEIGDVDKSGNPIPVTLNFSERKLEQENYYVKIDKGDIISADLDDILIAKVRPNLKKYVLVTEDIKAVYFTSAFIRIHPKKMPGIIYYCLRGAFFDDLIALSRQGKGYPTLTEADLSTIKFDKKVIDCLLKKEVFIEKKIKEINKAITEKKSMIRNTQQIIDSTFKDEFGYDYGSFEELKKQKVYQTSYAAFFNNPDLRFSAKFHRPAGDFVMSELTKNTDKRMKHVISEPIALGASIAPSDFDDDGRAYYISMATIKTLEIELDDTQLVSNAYYEKRKNDKSVRVNDIIIARSGVAIGKAAIVTETFDGIFADFTMRVRIDETKYNPMFAYYYIRSKYFQYLIEIYKKGLQNKNIFPIVLNEFPVPNVPRSEQDRIVKTIQDEIAKQDAVKAEISEWMHSIDMLILDAIR